MSYGPRKEPVVLPLETPKNLAARMGAWSATHRKKAILGWISTGQVPPDVAD